MVHDHEQGGQAADAVQPRQATGPRLGGVVHLWPVGVSRFARRRAWRILPPYWAALVFSLAVAWLVVPLPGQGAPDLKSVVVNGLLVQNLVGAPSPNRWFWSIAVEAQLYILFPLLLLMVRRRGPSSWSPPSR